jgi:hypothetical protein
LDHSNHHGHDMTKCHRGYHGIDFEMDIVFQLEGNFAYLVIFFISWYSSQSTTPHRGYALTPDAVIPTFGIVEGQIPCHTLNRRLQYRG